MNETVFLPQEPSLIPKIKRRKDAVICEEIECARTQEPRAQHRHVLGCAQTDLQSPVALSSAVFDALGTHTEQTPSSHGGVPCAAARAVPPPQAKQHTHSMLYECGHGVRQLRLQLAPKAQAQHSHCRHVLHHAVGMQAMQWSQATSRTRDSFMKRRKSRNQHPSTTQLAAGEH